MSNLDLYLWDVGHGLSVTLFTPEVNLLGSTRRRVVQYDLGHDSNTPFSPIDYLVENGIRDIDCLFISHPHQDHLSDAPKLAQHRQKGSLVLHTLHRNNTAPILEAQKRFEEHSAAVITYHNHNAEYFAPISQDNYLNISNSAYTGGVWFQSTHLEYPLVENLNDSSVVLSAAFGSTQVILPGDLEGLGFSLLKDFGQLPTPIAGATRILIAPHHGRYSAEPSELLEFYKPDIVLASAAYGDTYTDSLYSQCVNVRGHLICQTTGNLTSQKFCATKGMSIHVSIPAVGQPIIWREDHHHQGS